MAGFAETLNSNPWIGALFILLSLWCIIYIPRIRACEHKIEELEKENKKLAKKVGDYEKKENTD